MKGNLIFFMIYILK